MNFAVLFKLKSSQTKKALSKYNMKKNIFSTFGVLLFLGLSYLILVGYAHQRMQKQNEHTFYEEKIKTYTKVANVAGQIASERIDLKHFCELCKEFKGLYYGQSQLVEESDSVKREMVKFVRIISLTGKSDTTFVDKKQRLVLELQTLDLISACHYELEKGLK